MSDENTRAHTHKKWGKPRFCFKLVQFTHFVLDYFVLLSSISKVHQLDIPVHILLLHFHLSEIPTLSVFHRFLIIPLLFTSFLTYSIDTPINSHRLNQYSNPNPPIPSQNKLIPFHKTNVPKNAPPCTGPHETCYIPQISTL